MSSGSPFLPIPSGSGMSGVPPVLPISAPPVMYPTSTPPPGLVVLDTGGFFIADEPEWWDKALPFNTTLASYQKPGDWRLVLDDAPVTKSARKRGHEITAATLAARFASVDSALAYGVIRYIVTKDCAAVYIHERAVGSSETRSCVAVLKLLTAMCTMVPALSRLAADFAIYESTHPSHVGIGLALSGIDEALIPPNTKRTGDPWDELAPAVGETPRQLYDRIISLSRRLSGTAPKTAAQCISKFFRLLERAVASDSRFDLENLEKLRLEFLSPAAEAKYSTHTEIIQGLDFYGFGPFVARRNKRTLPTADEKQEALVAQAMALKLEDTSAADKMEKMMETLMATIANRGAAAPPVVDPKGDRWAGKIRPGSGGLKNLRRIIEHGVLGAGVTHPGWELNPARLSPSQGSPNDGMVASECVCCSTLFKKLSIELASQSPPNSVEAFTMRDYIKVYGVPYKPTPLRKNHFIYHYMAWCHQIHNKVNEYITSHPDEDCKWMLEVYTTPEWRAILTVAKAFIPRKFE